MFDHTQLQVWQRAHAVVVTTRHSLERRTLSGAPGLSGQLLRSCAAIAANISEGAGQNTSAQCARYLDIAIGSANETENHLAHAAAVGMLPHALVATLVAELREIRMMLVGFRKWVIKRNR